jgi:hypothetical protein
MAWVDLADLSPGQLPLVTYNQLQANVMFLRAIVDTILHNNSGGGVTEGYVAIQDTTASYVVGTTTVGSTKRVFVAQETIASANTGRFRATGVTLVNVTGTVAVGDTLQTSATAGRAQSGAAGSFARAITANPSGTGQVLAVLGGVSGQNYQTLAKAGSAAAPEPTANLIDGPGIKVTVTDNSGSSRTDITIEALPDYVTAQWFGSD